MFIIFEGIDGLGKLKVEKVEAGDICAVVEKDI